MVWHSIRRGHWPGGAGRRKSPEPEPGTGIVPASGAQDGGTATIGPGHRMAAWWRAAEWPVAIVATAAATALGMVGFSDHYAAGSVRITHLDAFYRSLQLFVVEWGGIDAPVPATLQAARFLAPLLTGFAAAKTLGALFRDELDLLWLRATRRGHVVVCGLGAAGRALARALVSSGWKVAGVESGLLPHSRPEGVTVVGGDAADPRILRRAGAARAAHLVAVCGSDDTNAAVARAARMVGGPSMVIHVHLRDARLATLLRTETLASDSAVGTGPLEFFTIEEHAARRLLGDLSFPADTVGEFMIVGLGGFGRRLLVEAARRPSPTGRPAIVTVVDPLAAIAVADVLRRHPGMETAAAITALSLDPASAEFEEAAFLVDGSGGCRARAIVVCLEDEEQALSAGLTLWERLKQVPPPDCPIDLVVCTTHAAGLAGLVAGAVGGDGTVRFRTFDLLGAVLDASLLTAGRREAVAAALHTVYLESLAVEAGHTAGALPLSAWPGLDEETREANRAAADGIGRGLRAVGCDLVPLAAWDAKPIALTPAEVELMAILEHRRWIAWKRAHRFRLAEVSDPARRTNAHLVPWDALQEDARERVRAFIRSLPRVLAEAGQQVVRLDRSPARSLHDDYVAMRTAAGETAAANPALVPWDLLPEHLKSSNRDQAAHLRVKLFAVGCDLAPGTAGPNAPLTPEEIERLAEMEHQRWCNHQRFAGWTPGPHKDAEAKTTPYLVPWQDLPEEMRDIDRQFARSLPDLARRMGQRIVRTAG